MFWKKKKKEKLIFKSAPYLQTGLGVLKNTHSLAPPNRADHGQLTPSASITASRFSCDDPPGPRRPARSRSSPPMEKPMRWNLGNIQHVVSTR